MSMASLTERRTTADVVFDHLYDQIISLGLMPGTKMSEAEIADQFGVSRQPVRDAFNRLGNMQLLLIQPQKATLVQKFSLESIQSARFIRLGVELEVARAAMGNWSDTWTGAFYENLAAQEKAVKDSDARAFHTLDEEFHALIAQVAGQPAAFDLILQKKGMVDRICVLSLKQTHEMDILVTDHKKILAALSRGDAQKLETCMREHLSRIEKTIATVSKSHAEYFTD